MKKLFLIITIIILFIGCNNQSIVENQTEEPDELNISKDIEIPEELIGIEDFGFPSAIQNTNFQELIKISLENNVEYQLLSEYMIDNYGLLEEDLSYVRMEMENDGTVYYGISSGFMFKNESESYPSAVFVAVYPYDEEGFSMPIDKKKYFYIEEHEMLTYTTLYVRKEEVRRTSTEKKW